MTTSRPWPAIRAYVDARMAEVGINSYTDLATAAGVDADTITNVLDGKVNPQRRTRTSLGKALGWPPDWLDYLRDGERPPDPTAEYRFTYKSNDDLRNVAAEDVQRLEEYARSRLQAEHQGRTRRLREIVEAELVKRGWSVGLEDDAGFIDTVAVWPEGNAKSLIIEVKATTSGKERDQVSEALGRLMMVRASDTPEEEYGSRMVLVTDLPIDRALLDRLTEFGVAHAWPGDWSAFDPVTA